MCMHRQVELQRTFKFKHSGREWTGIPLIVANMDTRFLAPTSFSAVK